MKNKLLLISVLSLTISNITQAEYSISIPLEKNKIIFEDPEVKGDIQLTKTQINRGDNSNIIWNYTYADEINIENIGNYNTLKGSQLVNPLESTSYNILIKSGDKSKTETLYLNVIQPTQNIEFNADSYRIGYGSSTNLNWNVDNAESINIDNGIGSKSSNGSYKVSPNKDTTYTLTAKGFTGISDKLQTVDIIVVPDAVVNNFTVDNDKLTVGETATFSWNVLNAESLTLNNETVNKTTGSKPVVFSTAGNFPYKLQTNSLSGLIAYSETKTINVYNSPIIVSFSVNPTIIDEGQSATLTFSTENSAYNEINGVNMGSNPTYVVSPTAKTTYTLTAKNDAGKTVTKSVTITVQNWSATTPTYGLWENVNGRVQYDCGTWSPNGSSATANTTFTQTASCLNDQTRTRQDRIISSATGEVKNSGAVIMEYQTISQTASRTYAVTYSAWGNTTVSSCSSWTPDTHTYLKGQVFTQTGTSCSGTQTRTRTESYIDHLSGSNVIVSTKPESQSVAGVNGGTRSAVGTYCVRCDN